MITMLLLFLWWFAALFEPPVELQLMLQGRTSFSTARIEWRIGERSVSGVAAEPLERARYYSATYTPGEFLLFDRGDETGCVQSEESCAKGLTLSHSELGHLHTSSGEQWNYREGWSGASVNTADHPRFESQPDIRTIGLFPKMMPYDERRQILAENWMAIHAPESLDYQVGKRKDGLVEVSASVEDGGIEWILDPDKDWQPVEVNVHALDQGVIPVSMSAKTTHRRVGDRWFPSRIEFTDSRQPNNQVVEVLDASFDHPDHPQTLTPREALGLVPGLILVRKWGEQGSEDGFFDGEGFISPSEYSSRIKAGTLSLDAYRELLARHNDPDNRPGSRPKFDFSSGQIAADVKRTPALWEGYVRRFIAHFRLDAEQSRKAWAHHAECLKGVRKHEKDHEVELKSLLEQIGRLEAQSTRTAEQETELSRARSRVDVLRGNTEKVFEERPQARLGENPTQAQIDAARAREREAARAQESDAAHNREAELSRTTVEP
ncbi:MAG: hypothetical protein HS102_17670 [Planctomycetia bacterium]|nr:hypothetical protein [Planctomycetia bacterium]